MIPFKETRIEGATQGISHGLSTKAPMAFITASDFPQLYAVVFGEGVLNDATGSQGTGSSGSPVSCFCGCRRCSKMAIYEL